MNTLKIEVVCSHAITNKEIVAAETFADIYDPNLLSQQVCQLIEEAKKKMMPSVLINPEICIRLNADGVRPSLHLDQAAITSLASIGASVDFDPYI